MSENTNEPDTPQKIWNDISDTGALLAKIDSFVERVNARKEMREKESARIQALIDAKAALLEEAVAALELVRRKWTFNNDQQPTHTWHSWADCIGPINSVLAKVREKGG